MCSRSPTCGANMLCGSQNNQHTNSNKLCSRIFFVGLLGVAACMGLALKYFARDLVLDLQWFQWGCINEKLKLGDDIELVCGGNQAVYRVCLGSSAFSLLMVVLAPAMPCFHNGCWLAKVAVFLGLVVACFFIPNQFFTAYYPVAVVMSSIFLVLQVMLVIDFSYRTHQCITAKFPDDEEGGGDSEGEGGCCNLWMPFYLGYCIVCVLITVGLIIGMYVVFSCGPSYGITSLVVAVAAICVILSLVEKFACGLLPGANVALYIVWLTWSGQSSNPDRNCNPHFSTLRLDDATGVALGFLITFASVAWMSISMHRGILRLCNKQNTINDEDDDDEERNEEAQSRLDKRLAGEELTDIAKADADKDKDKAKATQQSEAPTPCAERLSIFIFHFTVFVAGFYVAMICTYWVNATDPSAMDSFRVGNTTEVVVITGSYPAMGAKFGAAGVSFLLFLWTLLTPLCCDVEGVDDD